MACIAHAVLFKFDAQSQYWWYRANMVLHVQPRGFAAMDRSETPFRVSGVLINAGFAAHRAA